MKSQLYHSLLLSTAVALLLLSAARAEDGVTAIKFSDPAKPGTVKIILARGDVRIKGDDSAEVTVKSEAKPVTRAPRKDGLRVLTASSSFALTEKDNVITLDAASDGWLGTSADFQLTVPRGAAVVIHNTFGGDITCAGVAGDLEINSMNGEVRLDDVAGGALVNTMNGEIRASIRELHDGKPLSFTSMNGEVVLRVPAETKANVRLRTQNGSILTDFDEKALVTKTENTPRTSGRRSGRTLKAAPAEPTAPAAPAAPVAPTAPAAPETVLNRDTRNEIRDTVREAVRIGVAASREGLAAAREALQAAHEGMAEAGLTHFPSIPPLPPMTGGKLVSGTLNGGGPEISVATVNGDVTLRQLEPKK